MQRLQLHRLELARIDRPDHQLRPADRRLESGDRCPAAGCSGFIQVLDSDVKAAAGVRVRYLGCRACGYRPDNNKRIIPLQFAPLRRKDHSDAQ